jgi:hypothetical protein
MTIEIKIALVGDSDIAQWPSELLPSIRSFVDGNISRPIVSGHPGATLEQVLPRVNETLDQLLDPSSSTHTDATLFFIVCAGENDIGNEFPLSRTETAFRALLDLFTTAVSMKNAPEHGNIQSLCLIFLGPKFEPWLVDDMEARKSYVRMSQSFERICGDVHKNGEQHPQVSCKIHYIDCLTMFCGASSRQPGAVLGGQAIPQSQYFDTDQIHLCGEGYKIWQAVVEANIQQTLSTVPDV